MVQTIDSAMTVKRLRELADILESGRVELLNADIGISPCYEPLLVSVDKTTYSTLCTISIETKRKAKQ